MKRIFTAVFSLLLCLMAIASAHAQNETQQRVERYLYSNYNATKASLRENERIISILEEKLDAYLEAQNKEARELIVAQEKEIKKYLLQVEKVKDLQLLTQMVEESRQQNVYNLDRFINKGLSSTDDALQCRKIIVMRLAQHELLRLKHEKLLALLKDDHSRQEFILALLRKGKVKSDTELKAFSRTVDMEVYGFSF